MDWGSRILTTNRNNRRLLGSNLPDIYLALTIKYVYEEAGCCWLHISAYFPWTALPSPFKAYRQSSLSQFTQQCLLSSTELSFHVNVLRVVVEKAIEIHRTSCQIRIFLIILREREILLIHWCMRSNVLTTYSGVHFIASEEINHFEFGSVVGCFHTRLRQQSTQVKLSKSYWSNWDLASLRATLHSMW